VPNSRIKRFEKSSFFFLLDDFPMGLSWSLCSFLLAIWYFCHHWGKKKIDPKSDNYFTVAGKLCLQYLKEE
jgi:hypothetical protein